MLSRVMKLVGHGGDEAALVTIDSKSLRNISSFIKIDVERYEDHVLDGAVKIIMENRPVILCEIVGGVDRQKAMREQKNKIQHTLAKLKKLG